MRLLRLVPLSAVAGLLPRCETHRTQVASADRVHVTTEGRVISLGPR